MSIDELKSTIETIFNDKISLQVYFVLQEDTGFKLRLADIEDNSAAPELEGLFYSYICDSILNNSDLKLCELSTDDERVNAIYHYDYEDFPNELGIFKDFDIEKAIKDIPKFDFTKDDLKHLSGYIIFLGNMSRGLLLYKKHYSIALIKRDSFLLGAVKNNKRFEKISGEDIIRFNGSVQLMRVDEQVYVLDVEMLERNMGFYELIQKSANQTVQAISELNILEDVEVLKDAISEPSFARKLSKVQRNSPILKLGIPKESIVEFTKNTPALAGKFKYSEDGTTIRLDTKKSKDAFIKLMNDAFLHSELTKQYYEASAKDQLMAE